MSYLKQYRRTPWDEASLFPLGRELQIPFEGLNTAESPKPLAVCQQIFSLHGMYVFNPAQVTCEDFRQFMWAGLRVLRTQAKAKGMSEEQIRCLLTSAFDAFHDTADSIWTTLKVVVSKEWPTAPPVLEPPAPVFPLPSDSFVACEEDRPVPVKTRFRKPLTQIDPDSQMLASFEP